MRPPVVRFVVRLALFVLPVVAYMGLAFALFLTVPHHAFQLLQAYQEAKLEPNAEIETVLVGDSSLGNAIDAEQFSEETGSPTVSLALTGFYGYAGAYAMTRRALETFPNLKNVVVVASPDVFSRKETSRGLFLATPFSELSDLEPDEQADAFRDGFGMAISTEVQRFPFELLLPREHNSESLFVDESGAHVDYIRQSGKRASPNLKPLEVHPGKFRYLQAIEREAETAGVRVLYAHGPYWDEQLDQAAPYLDEAERDLAAAGVELVPGRPRISMNQMGDAADHVGSAFRADFTSSYADAIGPHLR